MSAQRRFVATADEQAEVRRRGEEGESLRAIAAAVFGSERFKDRVARIIRSPQPDTRRELEAVVRRADLRSEQAGTLLERSRELLALYRAQVHERLETPGSRVASADVLALAKLEQHVAALEQLERLNRLTRRRA